MKWLGVTAVCLTFLAVLGVGVWVYEDWKGASARQQLAAAEQQRGDAIVGQGQALTRADVDGILAGAKVREIRTQTIRETDDAAIAKAPGADAPLDPGLVRAINDGLCHADAYRDDPGCAALRAGPAGELPGEGRAPAAAPW